MSSKRPRLYFSLRSPYSWLTIHRLRERVPRAHEEIDWIPYWDPEPATEAALAERGGSFHYQQMSRAKHLYLLADTKRLAQRHGLAMAWPIDVDCRWEVPHLALLAARRHERHLALYDALVEARWGRGEDICQHDVLRRAAESAGLDPEQAVAAADHPEIRAEAVDCLVAAYNDDIFGIPYLKWGRHRFWGYDRLDDFLRLWHGAPAAATPPDPVQRPVPVGAAYDTDTAGGCG